MAGQQQDLQSQMTSVSHSFVGEKKFSCLLTNLVLNRREGAGLASACLLRGGRGRPLDLRHVHWKEFFDIDVIWLSLHVQSFVTSLQVEEFLGPSHARGAGSR